MNPLFLRGLVEINFVRGCIINDLSLVNGKLCTTNQALAAFEVLLNGLEKEEDMSWFALG